MTTIKPTHQPTGALENQAMVGPNRRRFLLGAAAGCTAAGLAGCDDAFSFGVSWPPKLDREYPDPELVDYRGDRFHLSDYQGKVILVETSGMNCPACNAFSGAERFGGFGGTQPQANLRSIETYMRHYAGSDVVGHRDVMMVQLLLYDLYMEAPDAEDCKLWVDHFRLDQRSNFRVAATVEDMRGRASYNLVPGFQLIDRDFVLRYDSSGHRPRHDLFRTLLPAIPTLLAEKPKVERTG